MDDKIYSSPSEGLGDTVAKFLHFTGVDKIVNTVAEALDIEDCGCNARREQLNQAFSYKKREPPVIEMGEGYISKNGRKIKVYS